MASLLCRSIRSTRTSGAVDGERATTPIVVRIVRLDTTVRKTAPEGHEERCDDDRAYQRDTIQ